MHMYMIFWQSQRTTERICLKKLLEWNTYGVCDELPDQACRGIIAVKNGYHEETDDKSFWGLCRISYGICCFLYFHDNDIAII